MIHTLVCKHENRGPRPKGLQWGGKRLGAGAQRCCGSLGPCWRSAAELGLCFSDLCSAVSTHRIVLPASKGPKGQLVVPSCDSLLRVWIPAGAFVKSESLVHDGQIITPLSSPLSKCFGAGFPMTALPPVVLSATQAIYSVCGRE